MRRMLPWLVGSVALAQLGGCGSSGISASSGASSSSSSGAGGGLGSVDDIVGNLPQSCSFACTSCAEPATPFACPTMLAWDKLPHDAACGTWDGTYPAVVTGKCSATIPSADAITKAGPLASGGLVLPDGHRITPAGNEHVFNETNLVGGFPANVRVLAGTHFAIVADSGIDDNAVRLVDLTALASGGTAVASYVPFPSPKSIFWGIAWVAPSTLLVSGGGDAMVYGFTVDTTAGTLTREPTKDVSLGTGSDGSPYFVGPVAVSADGQKLVVGPSDHDTEIVVLSLASGTYGKRLGSVDTGSKVIFDIEADPFDATGNAFYATDTNGGRLLELDVSKIAITRTVTLEKNPEQLLFLDATYALVSQVDADAIAIVDRATGTVATQVPVFPSGTPHGQSPSAMALDTTNMRLYATLAGINAVEAFSVTAGTPPAIVPTGRIPTGWWPTGVALATDGSLVVINGKGHGTGTDDKPYTWGQGDITERMHGSIQSVPAATLGDLTASTAAADANHHVAALKGASAVSCPAGADDFPVPATNTSGPSKQIQHVVIVVRENKTYDAVFGDRPDLGDGDASLIMASTSAIEASLWQNARAIAKTFTNFDNFYTDAEQSIQGHTWTAYARTMDFMERSWLDIWGRGTRSVETTATPVDEPQEGAVFQWLSSNKVTVDDMGEIIGGYGLDTGYPGLVYSADVPDIDKSCYFAGRYRLTCDQAAFTYLVQPNDHTYGGAASEPAPEVMIAVNDEATGMLLDAISHSPSWKDTLLIITEDDPQDGGDHVDLHRSVLLMASPWIKRGYVSHGHYDMASVYKIVAHVFGVPYHNDMVANALAPFDAFTSTPDYTPYTYLPRKVTAPCNAAGGKHAKIAERWDWTSPTTSRA